MQKDDLAAEARALRQNILTLSEKVVEVSEQLEETNKRVYRTVQRMKYVVFGLVLISILSVFLTGIAIFNAVRINKIQNTTSSEILCPLHKLFLDSYRPESQPSDRKQQYEEAFVVLRKSYATLGCEKG